MNSTKSSISGSLLWQHAWQRACWAGTSDPPSTISAQELWSVRIYMFESIYINFSIYRIDKITNLADNTDITLIPTINPDGFDRSVEGECYGESIENLKSS